MEQTSVQKLAKALKLLLRIMMIVNLIALFFVPLAVAATPAQMLEIAQNRLTYLLGLRELGWDEISAPILYVALTFWGSIWRDWTLAANTLFLLLCGLCCYTIMAQARRILDTIIEGRPFQMVNAKCMKTAATCCWIISGTALVRMVLWLVTEGSVAPLFTYNTLAIPAFAVAGLLFLVMSALFRQAAELKEDQDLTI